MSKKSQSNALLSLKAPWEDCSNKIWLATSLKLYRNLVNFHFPGKLSTEGRKQVLSIIQSAILTGSSLKNPTLTQAEEASPLAKEYLYEHFLAMHGFHQAHAGEAFVTDKTDTFLGILNIRDHLQLQIIDTTGEIEQSWNRLLAIENSLSDSLRFAYSDSHGFLTANSANCGTGLVISGFLQLPALIHTGELSQTLTKHRLEGVESTGLQGDANNLIGDVIVLYNNFTLGLTEEDIATTIRSAITRLFVEEKSARARIRDGDGEHMKDLVSRSYGLLMHSYQIETAEALGAISLVKLGLDLGWISGTDTTTLNRLFVNSRRGHLLAGYEKTPDPEQVLQQRAQVIREKLESTNLSI